jgi:hypothetical protein
MLIKLREFQIDNNNNINSVLYYYKEIEFAKDEVAK